MLPSEVRHRILQDHETIRSRLDKLTAPIARIRSGDHQAARVFSQRGCSFLELFLAHIELENWLLVPALREADAWGDVRADRVLREHREQTAEVRSLLEAFADPFASSRELAKQLEDFVDALELDMATEERMLLGPDLLRDDVVGIDVEAG